MELTKRDFGVSFLKKFGFLVGTSFPCRKKIPAPGKGLESSAGFLRHDGTHKLWMFQLRIIKQRKTEAATLPSDGF